MSERGTSTVLTKTEPRPVNAARWGRRWPLPRSRPGDARLRRSVVVLAIALTVGIALLAVWSLTLGDYPIGLAGAARAIFGAGPQADILVVRQWRLPRVLAALLAGAAFAGSGTLLQSLLRNPLASPDVIGVNMGATVVAIGFLVFGVPALVVPAGALLGAVLAALLLAALAWRGDIATERLVLIGIALHTALYAAKTFLILRYPEDVVQSAVMWTVGTLYNRTWAEVILAVVAMAVLVPVALVLLRVIGVLDLGDDLATGLGLPVRLARLGTLAVAVALAAIGVALAGPLPFVALAVPFLARLLVGPLTPATLLIALALGAGLLLGADVFAQHALPTALPAGVVTASVGAPLFFWLLWRHHRREGKS